MSPRRLTPRTGGKRALLAGAAVALLWSACAQAQTAPGPSPDGLQKDEMYMEAANEVDPNETQVMTSLPSPPNFFAHSSWPVEASLARNASSAVGSTGKPSPKSIVRARSFFGIAPRRSSPNSPAKKRLARISACFSRS